MTGSGKEWVFVIVFFAAFVAVTLAELYWLSNRKSVPVRQAMIVIFSPNFVAVTLGFLVSFLIVGVLLSITSGLDVQTPVNTTGTWLAFVVALAFPYLLMASVKRGLISLLRVENIESPLLYSLISSLAFFAVVIGLPMVLLFIF